MDTTPAGRLRFVDGKHGKQGPPHHNEESQKYKGDNASSDEYRNDSHRDDLHPHVQSTLVVLESAPCQAHTRDLGPFPARLESCSKELCNRRTRPRLPLPHGAPSRPNQAEDGSDLPDLHAADRADSRAESGLGRDVGRWRSASLCAADTIAGRPMSMPDVNNLCERTMLSIRRVRSSLLWSSLRARLARPMHGHQAKSQESWPSISADTCAR
jgi:hypothetical protein